MRIEQVLGFDHSMGSLECGASSARSPRAIEILFDQCIVSKDGS